MSRFPTTIKCYYKTVTKLTLAAMAFAILALAAKPAQANGILTFQLDPGAGCFVDGGTGSCAVAPLLGGHGISVFTIGAVVPDCCNGTDIDVTDGAASGTVALNDAVPVAWDFFVNNVNGLGSETVNWALHFELFGNLAGAHFLDEGGTANYGTEVRGSDVLIVDSADTLTSYSVDFSVAGDDDRFTISVPADHSFDLNAGTAGAAAPEPAGWALATAGFLGTLLLRRRQK